MEVDTTPAGTDMDNDLEAEVSDAILSVDGVRGSAAEVKVDVNAGLVTLSGYLQSPMAVVEVERAVEVVPGVQGIVNNLIDDGSLSRLVAEVLATNPSTSAIPPSYEVAVTFGYLRLIGWFNPAQAEALTEVARFVHGVRGVTIKSLS